MTYCNYSLMHEARSEATIPSTRDAYEITTAPGTVTVTAHGRAITFRDEAHHDLFAQAATITTCSDVASWAERGAGATTVAKVAYETWVVSRVNEFARAHADAGFTSTDDWEISKVYLDAWPAVKRNPAALENLGDYTTDAGETITLAVPADQVQTRAVNRAGMLAIEVLRAAAIEARTTARHAA